ncbi:MAG: hypothetical protein ABH884_04465 [Candidatus Komeilibacteria bacterium]
MKYTILLLLLLIPLIAQAGILDQIDCIQQGSCSLDQGLQTFVVFIDWGLGILGSLVLLMFIYGGMMWLTSGGKAEKVQQGKTIIINSIIGIIIVFSAYTLVSFLLTSLGSKPLEDVSQTYPSECQGKPNDTLCGSNFGTCQNNVCIEKCYTDPETASGGYACMDDSACDTDTIKYYKCFPPVDNLCCIPK